MGRRWFEAGRITGLAALLLGWQAYGQSAATGSAPGSGPGSGGLEAASSEIGRALFLRCLCAGDTLRFDAAGQPVGPVKTTDWTLAGVDIDKVTAKPGSGDEQGGIELDGVRVAIHFAADRHEFERKPQKDERVRLLIAEGGDAAKFRLALQHVFAQGIDRPLQQSLPEAWQHFFEPGKAWGSDELTGQTIFTAGSSVGVESGQATVMEPMALRKVPAESTTMALRNHAEGTVVLRVVVDADGIPHRVAVVQPLGYGLDAQAVAAVAKMRFRPGTLEGKPVAASLLMREDFVLVPRPGS